ncbi:MAG: hypothetical protein IPM55_09855 [Acidobacteria bacterium]|nr:hypothetical protein [Acidobacteriota bacterium]
MRSTLTGFAPGAGGGASVFTYDMSGSASATVIVRIIRQRNFVLFINVLPFQDQPIVEIVTKLHWKYNYVRPLSDIVTVIQPRQDRCRDSFNLFYSRSSSQPQVIGPCGKNLMPTADSFS